MPPQSTSSHSQPNKAKVLIAQCQHPRAEALFKVTNLLGLSSQLKKLASDIEVYDLLNHGLPNTVIRTLMKNTGFNFHELSIALGITEQTLKRRTDVANRKGRLSATQSVAAWQLAVVFMRTQRVMGSPENAKFLLCSEARSMRYRKPIELIALSPGVEFVSTVLLQLQHGVYI
jgi:putative toxin-antitoxin system antitoxin component (TIGR02293 family)